MSDTRVRPYEEADIPAMARIWNQVVEEGVAFPQTETLDLKAAKKFFGSQTCCGVAADGDGNIVGLYILHPNNVGRCGHIANASYAVDASRRGGGAGKKLVLDSLRQAAANGFRILQFNAVVATNERARRLYERLGFQPLGVIPKGFRMSDGSYEDICPYWIELVPRDE